MPIGPYVKWAVRAAGALAQADDILFDDIFDNLPTPEARRAALVFDRDSDGPITEDVATTSLEFINITSGFPDNTWTEADFAGLETLISTWWAAANDDYSNKIILKEIRWYRIGVGVTPPQPAVRVQPVGLASATVAPMLPPQVAMTLTFKTPRRKSWGRMYLPNCGAGAPTTGGYIAAAVVDRQADAMQALLEGAYSADFLPVVWSPSRQTFYAITELQVDDIFDVVRSRRWQAANIKDRRPTPP